MPFHKDVHETIMQEYREQADYYEQFDSSYCDRAEDDAYYAIRGEEFGELRPLDALAAEQDTSLIAAWVMEHGGEPFPT